MRRLRVAKTSDPARVAESIVFDLTHYGAAEATAAREGAVAVLAEALVRARGELLRRGFEVGAMPSLERGPAGDRRSKARAEKGQEPVEEKVGVLLCPACCRDAEPQLLLELLSSRRLHPPPQKKQQSLVSTRLPIAH